MEALIEQNLGDPPILAALLILEIFVMGEVSHPCRSGADGVWEMASSLALASLIPGMNVSDWSLYGMEALTGWSRLVAGWVPHDKLDERRLLLRRSTFVAGRLARTVPYAPVPGLCRQWVRAGGISALCPDDGHAL